MPAPMDFTIPGAPALQDPSQSFLQGIQQGVGLQQLDMQRAQQQAAFQQQQAKQQALQQFMAIKSPSASDFARLALIFPEQHEALKTVWGAMNTEQQQNQLSDASQLHAALTAGRKDVAESMLDRREEALKASGAPPKDIQSVRDMREWIKTDPDFLRTMVGKSIFAAPGGDKVIEAATKYNADARAQELQPSAVAKAASEADQAKSEAVTKGVAAKYAESTVLKDLELKGWNVENIKSEIGYRKESNRIAAMNAAANREGNELKRQELRLKIQETQQKMDDAVRDKVATAESSASNIDNMLNTIQRIKTSKGLSDVVGSLEGKDWYPTQLAAGLNIANPFGGSSGDDRADAIALIETLSSQAFLSQVPAMKSTGSLSNAEGDKLSTALQSLKRAQSEKQFMASLDEASRLVLKARENISKRYGVPLNKPDTPAAPGARPPLESFFK